MYWRVFRGFPATDGYHVIDSNELTFHSRGERRLVMPWATDLLPGQFGVVEAEVRRRFDSGALFPGRRVLFVGSVWARNEEVMAELDAVCRSHGLELSIERIEATADVVKATQRSYMAPAVQGSGHITSPDKFYVPCRIFKNISYGALGVTNNPGVNDLFGQMLVFAPDLEGLVDSYRARVAGFDRGALDEMLDLIREVRTRHTYANRLGRCLDALGS